MNARSMLESLRSLCRDIDEGRPPRRIDWKRLLAPMAAPAVGLALLTGGCGVAHERYLDDEICDNGVDDDGDGLVDCADYEDCTGDPSCFYPEYGVPFPDPDPVLEVCDNRLDDDLDGLFDCDDPDCADFEGCIPDVYPMYGEPFPDPVPPPEVCDNEIDDDGDGLFDCDDPDCELDPYCESVPVPMYGDPFPEPVPMEDCCNGVDDDLDELVDCDDPDCGDAMACAATVYGSPFENLCDNFRDDDCDGLVDCDDPDCEELCGGDNLYAAPFDG